MKYNLIKVPNESFINKLMRDRKRDGIKLTFLFHSPFDPACSNFISKLKGDENGESVYLIDYWETPHAFSIFHKNLPVNNSVPYLIVLDKDEVITEWYLPRIYSYFKLQ